MKHLTIRNIGPIKNVSIELKRFNLLIGLQSSGKSTINKIACYCSWVEKEISTSQSENYFKEKGNFESRLVTFHKIEGFIHSDAYIEYETDVMLFSYDKKKDLFSFTWKDRWAFVRPKTIYIPSERNIVATIPNWFDVKLEENNTRSYMSDWEGARKFFVDNPLSILNLGVKYVFDEKSGNDIVQLGNSRSIKFTNASSGLQSLIPLVVILEYVTKGVFKEKRKESVYLKTMNKQLLNTFNSASGFQLIYKDIEELFKNMLQEDEQKTDQYIKLNLNKPVNKQSLSKLHAIIMSIQKEELSKRISSSYMYPNYSNIFLEEPEQNLYPTTQKELINRLVEITNDGQRKHSVFITTHSPYILTSLNNLLYAAQVGTTKRTNARKIVPVKYWLQFEDVNAWFVKNGTVESILDKKLKQIKAEKIDEVSNQLNRDFDKLFDLKYEDE